MQPTTTPSIAPPVIAPSVVSPPGSPLTGPGTSSVVNGVVYVDGQPFFPLGFYGESWQEGTEATVTAIETIGGAGFNTVHTAWQGGLDFQRIVDTAGGAGVRLITEMQHTSDPVGVVIDRYKGEPAVLGWNIGDDIDDGRTTPADLLAQHQAIKAADPDHLTYASATGWNADRRARFGEFAGSADLIGHQLYPISPLEGYDVTPENALSETYARLSQAVDATAAAQRPVIANVQSFNWNGRYPTGAEARNMTYSALAAGVKGIVYYDYTAQLPQQTQLWSELTSLVPEVRALSPLLLGSTPVKVSTGSTDVVASHWTVDGRTVVVVVNTSYDSPGTVSVPLPAAATGPASPLFAGRPSGLTAANGLLTGRVEPQDVHVYEFAGE